MGGMKDADLTMVSSGWRELLIYPANTLPLKLFPISGRDRGVIAASIPTLCPVFETLIGKADTMSICVGLMRIPTCNECMRCRCDNLCINR